MDQRGEPSNQPEIVFEPLELLSLHDSLPLVLSFLSPADIRSAELVCLALREATRSSAWRLAAERLMQGTGILGDNCCVSYRLWRLLCEDAVIAAGPNVRLVLPGSRYQLQRQLLIAAISSSGCDRPEESHRNLLEHSVCDSEPQQGCTCHPFSRYALSHGGPLPCYWSSPASPTVNTTHTLDFALCNYVCLVRAIRIQCYCASFHPQQPVFAPRACKVSFGSFAATTSRCYEGAAHPCLHQREEQVVAWFEPPLLVVGGHLQLELTGAYQRSTLPSFPNDFYVALTHVVAEGRAVGYLKSAGVQVNEGQAATRGDGRGVWTSTMGAWLSLSDRATRWDRWVDSSAPPSGSAVTATPPAI